MVGDEVPSDVPAMTVLAVDPGTHKCGIAVVRRETPQPITLHREIVATSDTENRVADLITTFTVVAVVIGDATGGKPIWQALRSRLPAHIPLHRVSEAHTSERARQRYRAENPPAGWRRLLPAGLHTPPEPYDDYAAVILAEDWLNQQS
ncbi:MAG: hypothetical protein OHK0029_40920 [Armatimonadaceae bacterium]